MPEHDVLPFLLGLSLIVSVAGVLILRPLTKRLGDTLDAKLRAKHQVPQLNNAELNRLTDVVSRLTDRIESLEERQDFTERLMASHDRAATHKKLHGPSDA
ncbi:MAG TPA: hypothetical protein VLC48_00330 [Gemmatimonadota bacterium]|nr:hypothetical protein [Gemmatimonadota bacterium]